VRARERDWGGREEKRREEKQDGVDNTLWMI